MKNLEIYLKIKERRYNTLLSKAEFDILSIMILNENKTNLTYKNLSNKGFLDRTMYSKVLQKFHQKGLINRKFEFVAFNEKGREYIKHFKNYIRTGKKTILDGMPFP